MKTGYFQKTISSLSLAVLTGVVLFSVGSGSSATPEYSPPGTGVRPTFYGAKMLGSIENPQGDVVVDGDFQIKKIPGSTGLDDGDLTVDGGVYLNNAGGGGINLGSSDGTSKIYVKGALDFMNNDVTKNVINSLIKIISHDTTNGLVLQAPGVRIALLPNEGVSITNEASLGSSNGSKDLKGEMNLKIQGNLYLTGDATEVKAGSIFTDKISVLTPNTRLTFPGNLDFQGNIKNTFDPDASVTFEDKVKIDSSVSMDKTGPIAPLLVGGAASGWVALGGGRIETFDKALSINTLYNGAVKIGGELDVAGKLSAASPSFTGTVSADNLDIKMGLQITQGLTFDYAGTKPTADALESFIYHDSSGATSKYDNLIIQSPDNIKLVANEGTVQVQGKLVATNGIGTIKNYGITECKDDTSCNKITNGWAKFPIANGKVWQQFSYTHACPSGYIAIACTYNDEHTDHGNVNVLNLYNSGSNCYMSFFAKNDNAGVSPGIRIHASCWNPSL